MPQRADPLTEIQARLAAGEVWPANLTVEEFDALLIRVKASAPAWPIGLAHILDIIEQPQHTSEFEGQIDAQQTA